ncbi:phospholipase B [Heterostelium album PN500]|uniref:Phospholipase B-like n=1 Tax=Heterostelium pallidum (strain ATCC 26659 / Pp 5 / PN500) TaxID=670386 RepID=D3BKS0_HETP5|nr:phospholipase B [Heterostelium album PN500]EFA78500.1 phospholipase B [Heterostelium album PN500]|eukprot:XP_020430624.1 phospholipase B [Heterostelium album PN500]
MKFYFNILVLIVAFASLSSSIDVSRQQRQHTVNAPSNLQTFTALLDLNNGFRVVSGNQSNGVAWCLYGNEMMTTGWGYISIQTNGAYNDTQQASAAGYLEGYVSAEMIYQNWYNMYVNEYKKSVNDKAIAWIDSNNRYMQQQVAENLDDPYWQQVGLVMTQVASLFQGYNDATTDPSQSLEFYDILLMNMDGDMIDLAPALNISFDAATAAALPPKQHLENFMRKTGHCSSLIKLTDDLTELYAGHTTWSSFYEMVRMFKIYTFAFSSSSLSRSATTMFSSYPASLSSIDDFYLLDTGLVVVETTNGMMNNNLYYLVTPSSVLSWIRVIIANRMASNGANWCTTFGRENSGTYNNQWIIVDYNKFESGVDAHDGMVYVLEQIPGYVEYDDVTNIVRTGYWPSYNVPYFEYIYNVSGFNNTQSYGNFFSYSGNPRAMIFRRDANNVYTFEQYQAELRYNNWEHDPLSAGNSGNAISSRFDLVTKSDPNNPYLNKDAFGGIDSKAVNHAMVRNMQVAAQSGPTYDQQPPFNWKQGDWTYTHVGMPEIWQFPWMIMTTNNMVPAPKSN